jgi:hypothetical protein
MYLSALDNYSRSKCTRRNLTDAENANFIVAMSYSLILLVHIAISVAQICSGVISLVAIYVVDLTMRPFSVNVEPCKSMCKVRSMISRIDNYIAFCVDRPGWQLSAAAHKLSAFRVVVKKLVQPLLVYFHTSILPPAVAKP